MKTKLKTAFYGLLRIRDYLPSIASFTWRHNSQQVTLSIQTLNLRSVAWILWESLLLGVTFDRTPPPFYHTHPDTRDLKGLPESVIVFSAHNPLMTILLTVFVNESFGVWVGCKVLFYEWKARGSEIGNRIEFTCVNGNTECQCHSPKDRFYFLNF